MPTIRRTIDDLPRAQQAAARPPSHNMLVLRPVVEAWWEEHTDDYEKAIPELAFSASMMGQRCDRQLWYTLSGAPESNPPSSADVWRMDLGSVVHLMLQNQLDNLGGGWRREVLVDMRRIGIEGSAHADLVQFQCIHCDASIVEQHVLERSVAGSPTGWDVHVRCSDECAASEAFIIDRTLRGDNTWSPEHERAEMVCEFKTVGGYSFKLQATSFNGPPEGAKFAHVLQGGICADALGSNKLVVAYLSMELVSAALAKAYCNDEIGRFAAEWHYSIDELRPLLDVEYERIQRMMRMGTAGQRPAREIHDPEVPAGATIINPLQAAWAVRDQGGVITQTGGMWSGQYCNYCRHQALCIQDGADAQSADVDI